MSSLGLNLTNKLQSVDHWELIKRLSQEMHDLSVDIEGIHNSLNGRCISEARKSLAPTLARVDLLKDAIRMKFSVMDVEWDGLMKDSLSTLEEDLLDDEVPPPFDLGSLI